VERPIIQVGGKLHESKPKTRMGQRRIFLDHETAELLREHRKAQLRLRLKAGEAWQDNDLVFCQEDGRPWNPDHVSKEFKKQAASADVPVICLHEGGRHTGNSLMQDAGVDQELRMREVGHADKSVNDRYTPAGAGPPGRRRADGGTGAESEDSSMTGTDVLTLFSPEAGAAKPQPAGNGSHADQTVWGGWGSNPRPADYESAALTC